MSKDLERSLKDKIRVVAKAQNRAFNDVWKALALERFLVRLAKSENLDQFIFKGGYLLSKYLPLGRETVDLDFSLVNTSGSVESVKSLINDILCLPYDDGFIFDNLEVEQMNHPHMNYPGYEVTSIAYLGQTKTKIRLDLGIGDLVVPENKLLPLLSHNNKPLFESEISIQAYPLPYIFAEKLEAIVCRGGTNSRMKDFYDIILISVLHNFDLKANQNIIESVFEHHKTELPSKLSYDIQAKDNLSRSWKRFLEALEEEFSSNVPNNFDLVTEKINDILKLFTQQAKRLDIKSVRNKNGVSDGA